MELSNREAEIIMFIAGGFVDKEIGKLLNISDRTVQTHVSRIFLKLKAHNRPNAVAIYLKS